jgi:hypothetical protein
VENVVRFIQMKQHFPLHHFMFAIQKAYNAQQKNIFDKRIQKECPAFGTINTVLKVNNCTPVALILYRDL